MGLFKKKQAIDPVEFLVLRNELVELKERLDAAEQAKASLEDRLSSLAATTMVLSSNAKSDTAEIVEKIESLEHRIDSSLDVGAKVDELHQRVIDVEQNAGAGAAAELQPRLAELSQRLDEVAELAAAPVAPDDELAGRLDALTRSAQTVELLQQQIGQLNARISTQADLADQVTALSDRIGLLQQRNADSDRISQRLDELARLAGTEELAERLVLLGQRVTATEEAARLATEQAATRAELTEQLAALQRRIAEAPAPAESASADSTAALEARLAELDAQLQQQAALAERLASLDEQVRAQAALAERVAALDERLAAVAAAPAGAGITVDPAAIGSVTSDLERLRQIVELRSADVAGLRELIDVRSGEIAQLQQQLASLSQRTGDTEEDARTALRKALVIDERIQNVSTQLANQLSELSRDMDSLAERQPAGGGVDHEALQSLRSGQVKLAAEQARYEISFREDLAVLAEQVRQLRGR
jgi:exonuclease SbcC